MSVIPSAIIKTYAESLGITNLSEEFTTALAQDLEYRTREIIQEAAKLMGNAKRTKLTIEDINYALQSRNVERLYGYDPAEALTFRLVPNTNIFYVPREEIDLETYIQQPLPKAPQPLTLTSHWLAIEGVQPMIPENPNLQEPGAYVDREGNAAQIGPVSRKDVQEDAEIKPLIKHILSKELQAYYDAVVTDITSPDPDCIKAALYSVATDSGLQQLLPYFIQFVSEMVPKNLRNLSLLQILIGLVSSLLANEHIFIEPYLHQIMPAVLSCLLGKSLCEDPLREDHWSLRERCAVITADLCRKYGNVYASLVPRVSKTLLKTLLDPQRPLPSHYGAIVGLTALGVRTIETLLLPHIESYLQALDPDPSAEQPDELLLAESTKCRAALRAAAAKWLDSFDESDAPSEQRTRIKELFNL